MSSWDEDRFERVFEAEKAQADAVGDYVATLITNLEILDSRILEASDQIIEVRGRICSNIVAALENDFIDGNLTLREIFAGLRQSNRWEESEAFVSTVELGAAAKCIGEIIGLSLYSDALIEIYDSLRDQQMQLRDLLFSAVPDDIPTFISPSYEQRKLASQLIDSVEPSVQVIRQKIAFSQNESLINNFQRLVLYMPHGKRRNELKTFLNSSVFEL